MSSGHAIPTVATLAANNNQIVSNPIFVVIKPDLYILLLCTE